MESFPRSKETESERSWDYQGTDIVSFMEMHYVKQITRTITQGAREFSRGPVPCKKSSIQVPFQATVD